MKLPQFVQHITIIIYILTFKDISKYDRLLENISNDWD